IQRWLADSTTSHFKCRINSSSKWLPSRLIDVGSVKDDVEPFLYVPSEDRVGGDTFLSSPEQAYITLSHCWGACQPTKLLRENYGTMRKRIRSQNLPKTFQDAISVTRHLGVRYLWIDALCIIQDSPDDWHQEATLMEKVYRNSKCTIAASGAVDGLGGCFFSRDIRLLQPFQVKASFGLLPGQMCLVVPGAKVSSRIARHTLLYQRAWVLQERLLSPRSIHFGKEQVSWECYECHASETFPYHQHSKFVNRGLQTLADLVAEVKSASELEELRSPYGLSVVWSEALTNYTSLGLTKPQDKLIALAGIATAMKPKVGDYLAGMWKCLLPFGLLWTPTAPAVEGHRSRPPQYRAPSWSWASMEGQI
ncbi:HET-domain-containing protein, partial [Stipitochalara longipes BDJ]